MYIHYYCIILYCSRHLITITIIVIITILVYAYVYIYIHTYDIYIYICLHVCVYIYIYICICIHRHPCGAAGELLDGVGRGLRARCPHVIMRMIILYIHI